MNEATGRSCGYSCLASAFGGQEQLMTDSQLLRAFNEMNDQAAFAQLVARHGGMVYATARRIAGDEADDVSQATFLLLAKHAARLAHRESVAGWLHETTRLCAKNVRRARWRRTRRIGVRRVQSEGGEAVQNPPIATEMELLGLLDDALAPPGRELPASAVAALHPAAERRCDCRSTRTQCRGCDEAIDARFETIAFVLHPARSRRQRCRDYRLSFAASRRYVRIAERFVQQTIGESSRHVDRRQGAPGWLDLDRGEGRCNRGVRSDRRQRRRVGVQAGSRYTSGSRSATPAS